MYRNRYAGRTFIQPSAGLRQRGVTIKLNPLREVVNGKRLIVVDDSIVRGTTTKRIVELLREAGAASVHVRISAPPIYHPCFYGIDTQIETELIASTHTEPEIRDFIGADSLGVPVDPRRARRPRAAIRAVLLRLFRRALPRARAVRRGEPEVHARGRRVRRPWLSGRGAYRASGVDVAAGERAVELMRGHIESTRRPEVIGGLGGFGAAIGIPPGYREPLLVASTDGVGTKTAIAASLGRFDTIGIDLVAMCADDVVCCGAEPLAFLDYVAVGQVVPEWVAELVGSVAAGCREAGCALVGGETAEHPGLMDPDAFDLSGCCIGVVERAELIDGSAARAGDAIIGLAASGLHSNGFSLVRALLAQWDLDLAEPYQARLRRSLGDAETEAAIAAAPNEAMATLGEVLLTPTRMYARAVLAARAARPGDRDGRPRPGPHHRRRIAWQRAAGPARWPGGAPRPGALAHALGDAPVRGARRAGRRRAARHVQRRHRDGGRSCPRTPRRGDRGRWPGRASTACIVGEVIEASTVGGARYVEGPLEGTR